VEFTAYLPHGELPARYQAAWLTVVPMELEDIDGYFDGAIQESLACGTPVAALKASPRTPTEGSRGFLLPKRMTDAAAEIATLLDAPETLEAMARKGARFVRRHCTEARLKETLRGEWEGVLKR
jgi:glycosyltransferase involved in cell wall biosynthesis